MVEKSKKRSWKWVWIPVIFAVWTYFEYCLLSLGNEKVPILSQLSATMDFQKMKTVVDMINQSLEDNYWFMLFFVISNFIYLQTWCIPGTFIVNMMAGALFGTWKGLLLCNICNTFGAWFAYLLSKYFLRDLMFSKGSFLDKKIQVVKKETKIESFKKDKKFDLLVYLTVIRVFPGTPNWVMNLTFSHVGVSSKYFLLSMWFGLAPWNFCVCEAGATLQKFKTKQDILNPWLYSKMVGVAVLFLVMGYLKNIIIPKNKEGEKDQVKEAEEIEKKEK